MFKAAIKREENDARINYPERKQARGAASMFNEITFFTFSLFSRLVV